jgi:ketosteroid isomerase-like protein
MSWREALFCLLVLVSAVSVAGAEPQRVRSDQEILIQLERDWDAALHRADADFIETILADEYIATYPDGSRGDKAKELALTASFNQAVESSMVDEFTVKVYGDTAVVWFTQHVTGSSQGRTLEVTYRYVDVFVIRDGRWQCVTSPSTRVTATA